MRQFSLIALVQLAAVLVTVAGAATEKRFFAGIITPQEMAEWLANHEGEITYVGLKNHTEIVKRAAESTTVTYCAKRSGNLCSGPCTVSTGNGVCINAPGTQCLAATTDVAFCDYDNCRSSSGCHNLSQCGTRLNDGYCYTPGTNSISIPST